MAKGDSPLLFAAQNGHDATVKLLMEKGADVNIVLVMMG